MKKNRLSLALASASLLSLAVAGCGGGGGGDTPPAPAPVASTDMTVTPALGKYRNGGSNVTVTLKDRNGATVKTGTWNNTSGTAQFLGVDKSLSPLIVELSGGEYFDEAAKIYRPNTRTQRAVVDKPYPAVAVTPLTNAAAKRLIDGTGKIPSTVDANKVMTENLKEGKRFGIANPLIPPVLVGGGATEKIASTDNLEAQRYAAILAGMAKAANNAGKKPDEMAEHLATDLADDKLDGKAGTTPISGLAYTPSDVTTSFPNLINSVIQNSNLTADTGTLASLQASVTAEVAPPVQLTDAQIAEVVKSVTVITAPGDSFAPARLLFSSLRSGVTPYVNPQGTGYTQTALTALQADFGTLTSATVGVERQVQALGEGTEWLFKRIGGNATLVTPTLPDGQPATYQILRISYGPYSRPSVMCFDDAGSVKAGLYEATTTAAIVCSIPGEVMWSADRKTFDRVVYSVYTSAPTLSDAPNNTTINVKWSSRVDRYTFIGYDNFGYPIARNGTFKTGGITFTANRIVRGVGSAHADGDLLTEEAPKNRRNGTFSATATVSETFDESKGTLTEKVVASLNNLKGDLWPVVNNTAVNTTDGTAIDLNATMTFQMVLPSASPATPDPVPSESVVARLSGSMIAYKGAGKTEIARLSLAPADGKTDIVNFDDSALSTASGGLKVTFATPKYEISGQVSADGLTRKEVTNTSSWYTWIGVGGDYNYVGGSACNADYNACFVQVAAGTGAYNIVTNSWSDTSDEPNKIVFGGTVKNLVTNTTIFEGSFTGTADYSKWNPSQPESTTNYLGGSATLIGKLKKSSTDVGLSLTAVFTKSAFGDVGNAWKVDYKDANGLTVSATFKESDNSGTITNSANSVVITWYRDNATRDGDVKAGTTVLGKIVGGIVTYVDGSTESIL